MSSDGYLCPGAGKCHGCMGWCDECGDVAGVCDAEPCWQHRCIDCNKLLDWGEREMAFVLGGRPAHCFACYAKDRVRHKLECGAPEREDLRDAQRFIAQFQRAS